MTDNDDAYQESIIKLIHSVSNPSFEFIMEKMQHEAHKFSEIHPEIPINDAIKIGLCILTEISANMISKIVVVALRAGLDANIREMTLAYSEHLISVVNILENSKMN